MPNISALIKVIASIGLLLAIPGECVLIYTQYQDARTQMATAINARERQLSEANSAIANAKALLQAANHAAELKKAEADKLFADARATEEVANNAKSRQAAEAQIAVEKAKQELANAQNAERQASADADKMEADAVIAKQFGDTSIQRSKAEAEQARANFMAFQSKLRSVWKYPYNCTRYKTFPDCVDGLRKAVADGRWSKP